MNRVAEIAAARAADEQIAAAWAPYWDAAEVAQDIARDLRTAQRAQARSSYPAATVERIARLTARLEAAQAPLDELRAAAVKLDRELYTGWTRFYLVKHIHNTTACSSFRPTTRIGWLPNLSGQTEAEAVAEHGAILCTKCFPSAPVEYTDGRGTAGASDVCPGSGKSISLSPTTRTGFAAGNWAECPDCAKLVGMPYGAHAVRKHKRPGA